MQVCERVDRPSHVPPERELDVDIYQLPGEGADFHHSWRALQDTRPADIVWTSRNGGHWLVMRGELVNRVLSDSTRFSSRTVLVPKDTAGEAYRLLPLSLDPPQHRPFRNLLAAGLSPRAVSPIEDKIRALAAALIEGFKGAGKCDFTSEFAEQLPVRIFMQIVDLPSQDVPKLKYLADQFTRPDGTIEYPEVVRQFREYLGPIIEQRRGGAGTDMLSSMINGQVDGRNLTDEEATNICMQVLVGGLDTVVNFLGFVMLFLAENPDHRRALAADPAQIPGTFSELVRRFPLVTVGREVVADIEFEGVQLKRGEMVVCPTVLHGLDDSINPAPFTVDFSRKLGRHSTFGAGSHTCPGAHLARTELRIALQEWFARIPEFQLAPDHKARYTGGIVGSVSGVHLVWDTARWEPES